MSCTVTLPPPPQTRIVTPANMKSGEIGRIVKWWGCDDPISAYVGRIVKRAANKLFALDSTALWTLATSIDDEDYQIEVFPPGTKIEITVGGVDI